jgi:hypothetical protein
LVQIFEEMLQKMGENGDFGVLFCPFFAVI